nr:ribonuclease H-like domain-containing protein [Tanacetum cinerariifolium]
MVVEDTPSPFHHHHTPIKLSLSAYPTRALNLDNELHSIKIRKMTVKEYCTKIKSMADRLKNLGCVVSDKNLVIYTVSGLDFRCATLFEIICHRETLPTFETTRTMLLLKESLFTDNSGATTTFESSSSSPTVLMTSTSSSTKGNTNKPSTISQICNHFNKGTYKFGDQCKFIHDHRNRVGLSSSCNQNRRNNSSLASIWNTSSSAPPHYRPANIQNQPRPPINYQPSPIAYYTSPSLTPYQLRRSLSSYQAINSFGYFCVYQFHHLAPTPRQPRDEVLRSLSSRQFISCNKAKSTRVCHACQLGKHVKLPFHSLNSPVKQSFDIIHFDLWTSVIWPIYQLVVKNVFLNGDLSETMYMHQPPGFVDSRYPNHQIVDSLHKEFDMTYLGALNYFLGISAIRHPTGLFLSHNKFALQLLERAYMTNCNSSRTPVDTDSKLGPDGVPVCLYMHDMREPHFAALKRILRYVQGTLELCLHLYASATTSLVGYTDANWVGYPSSRRSTFGYCMFLGDNLLLWSAKRQHTISRSSAEAEYLGVANVFTETAWIHNLLHELHSPLLIATLGYCDNVSAVYMPANPIQHQHTKHIEIDIHWVHNMVKAGHVRVLHVLSCFQYADIFTKCLSSALFEDFWSILSVYPPPAQTVGAYYHVHIFSMFLIAISYSCLPTLLRNGKNYVTNNNNVDDPGYYELMAWLDLRQDDMRTDRMTKSALCHSWIYEWKNMESSNDIISSDDEWEEYEYGNPPDTTTDSFLKPYMKTQEKNNIKREDE